MVESTHHMENETEHVYEIKCLLKKAAIPRWLHHYGPKRYELGQHILGLLTRELFQLSFRRAAQLLRKLGLPVASKSTLHYTAKRIPLCLWQRLLAATLKLKQVVVAAMDATGFSRSGASWYYLRRIDGTFSRKYVKVSVLVETRTKKVLSACVRMLPRHDTRDVSSLLKNRAPKILVADKGYDSEKVHELCSSKGIVSMIPLRARARKGFYRKKMHKRFRLRTYHRRSMVESVFASLKKRFGSSVRCCKARTVRAQIFCRLILHNMICYLVGLRTLQSEAKSI